MIKLEDFLNNKSISVKPMVYCYTSINELLITNHFKRLFVDVPQSFFTEAVNDKFILYAFPGTPEHNTTAILINSDNEENAHLCDVIKKVGIDIMKDIKFPVESDVKIGDFIVRERVTAIYDGECEYFGIRAAAWIHNDNPDGLTYSNHVHYNSDFEYSSIGEWKPADTEQKSQLIEMLLDDNKVYDNATCQVKKWVPEENETYWYITDNGETNKMVYSQNITNLNRITFGNAFATKKAAEKYIQKIHTLIK